MSPFLRKKKIPGISPRDLIVEPDVLGQNEVTVDCMVAAFASPTAAGRLAKKSMPVYSSSFATEIL